MIVITASYPHAAGKRFDETYCLNNHIAPIREALGDLIKDAVPYKGLPSLDGSAPSVFYQAHIHVASIDDAGGAFAGPRLGERMADTANIPTSKIF